MRAIWSGTLSFGLVNIPVKLYSATHESRLDLDMLDKKDMSHIHFKRVNEETGREVQWENIVKAYKYEGEYVILEDEDFERANAKKTKVIEIQSFAGEDEIDPIYYENAYYVEPEKTGTKAYALLREALKKTKRVGIASFVMRSKETLCVVKGHEDVIILDRIRFEEEIRDFKDLKLPGASQKIAPKELKMAVELIENYTESFDISEYKDEYTHELMRIIEAKAKGRRPKVHKLEVIHTKSKDIMEQLKASLETRRKAS